MGLWMTLHSCFSDLERTDYNFEFCICINGEGQINAKRLRRNSPLTVDTERCMHFLSKTGRLGYLKILQNSVSPPTARQLAAERAKGKYMFFFDNHVMVCKDYFKRALLDFEKYDMGMIHSTTKFFEGDPTIYHYKLKLTKNFWAEGAMHAEHEFKPYKCAAGGHGGFIVKADTWREMGGYWKGFVGYGAEEITTDLQWWMRGKSIYIDPLVIHYHWAGQRGYARHYSADYFRNMMMSANIIGGEKWLWKVYDSFNRTHTKPMNIPLYSLMEQAYERSIDEANRLKAVRLRSLEEQLELFTAEQVAQ